MVGRSGPLRRCLVALAVVAAGTAFVSGVSQADAGPHFASFPVDGTCSYEDSWHAPRGTDATGNPLYHEGIDIIAKTGVPIRAVADGRITRMSTSTRGGNQLYLTQPDGTYFFHAHVSTYAAGLVVNQDVHVGDVIAYVGQTGDAQYSVPHLHFEVHPAWNAKNPVNPFPYVRELTGCGRTGTGAVDQPGVPTPTTLPTTSTSAPSGTATTTPKSTPTTTPASPVTPAGPSVNSTYTGARLSNGFDGLTAIVPSRLADSRSGSYLTRLTTNTVNYLTVVGRGGVPANASAVQVNLTVSNSSEAGWMRAWPCGQPTPATSSVNFSAGQSVSNTAVIGIGSIGRICFQGSTNFDLVVDAVAWQGLGGGAGFVAVQPTRLFDSREVHEKVKAGTTRRVRVPDDTATAATFTVTGVWPTASGDVTVWPCGTPKPDVPSLRVTKDITAANTTASPLDATRELCVMPTVDTDLIVDLTGTWQSSNGARPTPIAPVRSFDSRVANKRTQPLAEIAIPIAGLSGVPANATSALVNITVADTLGAGYVTAWPCGTERPVASVLNYGTNHTVANATLIGLGGGKLCVAASERVSLIVDVTGYLI
jgi:hypothetical protein